MKVQLHRKRRNNTNFNPIAFDEVYTKGVAKVLPIVGESFDFYFERNGGRDCWRTTPVQTITLRGKTLEFTTLNSVYILKKGWGA